MYYVFKNKSGFGFKVDGIHKILDTDVPITEENYNKFFELQSQGKQFKIKDMYSAIFNEIFEEVIPAPIQTSQQPTVQDLQKQIFDLTTQLVLGGVI